MAYYYLLYLIRTRTAPSCRYTVTTGNDIISNINTVQRLPMSYRDIDISYRVNAFRIRQIGYFLIKKTFFRVQLTKFTSRYGI